jgi:hypothetical protein
MSAVKVRRERDDIVAGGCLLPAGFASRPSGSAITLKERTCARPRARLLGVFNIMLSDAENG